MIFPSKVKGPVVYLLTNSENEKIYVGSCAHIGRRVSAYRWSVETSSKPTRCVIVKAMRKHGFGAFTCHILQNVDNRERLKICEQFWIDCLHPFGERGYNVAKTAAVNTGWSPANAQEVSEKRRVIALRHGEDTRLRSSRQVYQIDKNTLKIVAKFPSALAADMAMGLAINSINKVCRDVNSHLSARGYYWAYADVYDANEFQVPDIEVGKRKMIASWIRPVAQLDEQGKTIKIWESGFAAARAMEVHCGTVSKACSTGKRCKGFKWQHITDEHVVAMIRQQVLEGTM